VAGFRSALRDLNGQLDREMATVQERWIGSLESLVRIGEIAHPHFLGHALRVADIASTIAAAMGESDEFLGQVRLAGRLHDLGMIGVPVRLLEKPGALTDQEFELIQQHPRLASDILSGYPDFAEVTRAIRGHHEHWDGSGYPARLVGNEIPRMARILAVAEVFDALTSARPYQPAEGVAHALRRVEHLSGTVLDPGICALLPRIFGRRDSLTFVHDLPAPRPEAGPGHQAGHAA
jgi:HD-GYP domain-containing protein (c-di-GMP phosphodiesterase class II)